MPSLSRAHRRFFVVDQVIGPIFVNFLLNAGIAWLMFRSATAVPLWGDASIAGDTLVTAFVLPVLTALIVGRLVPRQVLHGALPPLPQPGPVSAWARRSSLQRGAALGAVAVVTIALPVVLAFAFFGPQELGRSSFIWFKASFAAALGIVVTPLIGWWTLIDASARLAAAPAPAVRREAV